MHSIPINFLNLLNGTVQYVVPRWQRRYCWGQQDIERLVEDLLAAAEAGADSTHYGGTLLTYSEPGPAGMPVETIRVVDGQQRLTTVSILLASIADRLGPDGAAGGWTGRSILDNRIRNHHGAGLGQERKLRLQDADEDEYRYGLEGRFGGSGAVAQAWNIARRLVAKHDVASLLEGLGRLRVVSIGLDHTDDAQQIFQSLNATGRPLTESEKVKNWLLMGLPDAEQQVLHEEHWLVMEEALGAQHSSAPIDIFLRDVLRWWTGETPGISQVYEGLRRWAMRNRRDDRPALCRELSRLAKLYGVLTATAGPHADANAERELGHLRELGIHVHRPLSLRLLNDAHRDGAGVATPAALASTLGVVSTWLTRMWLADRQLGGLNKAFAELAHEPGPASDEGYVDHWVDRINRRWNTRVGMPANESVREGIRTRKAYGGSATQSAFAVLCELMRHQHGKESIEVGELTIEHVMPRKLSAAWKEHLAPEAEAIHDRYLHRFANLTLTGYNPEMGNKPFAEKREYYRDSPIGLTRCLGKLERWDESALEERADDLAERALARWPWDDHGAKRDMPDTGLRWRISGGEWRLEHTASQMILNVVSILLDQDPANAERLLGPAITSDLLTAADHAPDTFVGALKVRQVPGWPQYTLHPYGNYSTIAKRCSAMGKQCDCTIDVETPDNPNRRFWRRFKDEQGGLPGQKDTWQGPSQWTAPLNETADRVAVYIGNADLVRLYVRAGESQDSPARADRMRRCSWKIRQEMGDQQLDDDLEGSAVKGWSISVQRAWQREEEDAWPEVALWIKEQFQRIRTILNDGADATTEG